MSSVRTRSLLALAWLAIVVAAGVQLAVMAVHGIRLETDIMALLPREDRDPALEQAKDAMAALMSRRVVVMAGHPDAAAARKAASFVRDALFRAAVLTPVDDIPGADALARLGAVYLSHRHGLLADADRTRLMSGQADAIAVRAKAAVFGLVGLTDGRMIARDPYLLLPSFLAGLPSPASRLVMEEGWPTVASDGITWVLLTGELPGAATSLQVQRRISDTLAEAMVGAAEQAPAVRFLRLGSVFYAQAGAEQAMHEASVISLCSLAGTMLLMLLAFRRSGPLLLAALAIGVGMVVALSATLLLFGEIHTASQLFGASLIGIAVDYALLYACQVFSDRRPPRARLAHVFAGITLGVTTTVLGCGTLALSPFPGLRQVAAFSAIGLTGSFLTVVLWFPLLDRAPSRPLGRMVRRAAAWHWALDRTGPRGFAAGLALALLLGGAGFGLLRTDDDIRHQQALSPDLVRQQAAIERLTGIGQPGQFFLVDAPDEETALQRDEALGERLAAARKTGLVAGWRSPAAFAPSARRQAENRALVDLHLGGERLTAWRAELGLADATSDNSTESPNPLHLDDVIATGALPIVAAMRIAPGLHLIMLDGPLDAAALRHLSEGIDGVRFVDPMVDFGAILTAYRHRAVALLAISVALMWPPLAWRYGMVGGLRVLAPPAAAVVLTPMLLALCGVPFSFFTAMALVLVLSVAVDYAVFCAEDGGRRDPVVLVSIGMCMTLTLLSFGLMIVGSAAGMRAFGATMAVGVALAFLLAPLAVAKPGLACSRPSHVRRTWPLRRAAEVLVVADPAGADPMRADARSADR